jgi:hypothetical protein
VSQIFLDIDFAAIQARVNAWLAGEDWKLQAYRDYDAGMGPDLYKRGYARSFGVPIGGVTKKQRQQGKVAELMCGFQGSVGAVIKMGPTYGVKPRDLAHPLQEAVGPVEWASWLKKYPKATDKRGLPADEWAACKILVTRWRQANPRIASSWKLLENAARTAIDKPGVPVKLETYRNVTFYCEKSILFIKLPSGRNLHYWNPRIREKRTNVLLFADGTVEPEEHYADPLAIETLLMSGCCQRISKYPQRVIHYDGKDDRSSWMDNRSGRLIRLADAEAAGFEGDGAIGRYSHRIGGVRIDGWGEKTLYGGIICENIVMGAEHDIHRSAMVRAAQAGYRIALHTHDSLTAEIPAVFEDILTTQFSQIVGAPVPWAPELPMGVSIHAGERYS